MPKLISSSASAPADAVTLAAETLPSLSLTPRLDEIFRCLGYGRRAAPPAAIARAVEQLVADALPHLRPRGTYSLYQVEDRRDASLSIGGLALEVEVAGFLHGAHRIAVFLVTAGNKISRLAEERCRAGDAFAGWALDGIGSWAAEAAADALMTQLQPHLDDGEALSPRYSPGYCGMDLSEQRKLFRLLPADAVGVSLLPSLLMEPLKSVSGIVGLGPRVAVATDLTPCDRCPLVGCHMRR